MKSWFKEECFSDWAQTFEIENVVLDSNTKFQKIDIFDTKRFGRVLALDGAVQCTEKDEFVYHEMLTHVPINAYGDVRSVLIIGGGDGGVLEEVLKHKSVRTVTMVEIDEEVVNAVKEFMPLICKGAFKDPRSHLIIADAIEWVKTATDKFDVIIVDRTDCQGPASGLYSNQFYQQCSKLMTPQGIFVAQVGGLFVNENHKEQQLWFASQAWKKTSFYLMTSPTYVGGFMTIMWCSNWNITTVDTKEIPTIPNLQYYNANIHKAAFAIPNFASNY